LKCIRWQEILAHAAYPFAPTAAFTSLKGLQFLSFSDGLWDQCWIVVLDKLSRWMELFPCHDITDGIPWTFDRIVFDNISGNAPMRRCLLGDKLGLPNKSPFEPAAHCIGSIATARLIYHELLFGGLPDVERRKFLQTV